MVSTAELRSERLSFDVVDARKAAFYVAGVRIGALGGGEPGPCRNGLFTPARGATVTYGRVGKGPIEITLTPAQAGGDASSAAAGSFEPADGSPAVAYRDATAILTDKACEPPGAQRLPIWGHLRIGQEFRPAASRDAPEPVFLLGGKLEVAAHAIYTRALYEVTTVTVPVGARLETYAPDGAKDPEEAIWWGAATADPDHVALEVAAATEAPSLALYRPNQTDADIIKLSALTQLAADPSILFLSFVSGIVLFFLGCCASLARLWHEHEEGKERRAERERKRMRQRRPADRSLLGAATLLGALLAAQPTTADVVRLKVSADTFGQGWMFLDADGVCKVVTAGHVVRGIDGALRQPLVLDGRGREWTTGPPALASADPDVAVLPIPAAASPADCGDGRFSAIGVARRVANLADGIIRTTGDSEIRDVPVSRRAAAIDSSNGALFAVKPKLAEDVYARAGAAASCSTPRDRSASSTKPFPTRTRPTPFALT